MAAENNLRRLCVYAGSSFGRSEAYRQAAADLGASCARAGIGIVYGGGSVGLMGILADAALAEGGEVIGVIPRVMIEEERGHNSLTELIAVDTMHQRKSEMARLSSAFAALPGGIGTLEEFAEALTWLQLGFQLKPVGLLNVESYYTPFLTFLSHMQQEGFITEEHLRMLTVSEDPQSLLDQILAIKHTVVKKPIHRPST